MVYCKKCGKYNSKGNFCKYCGSKLTKKSFLNYKSIILIIILMIAVFFITLYFLKYSFLKSESNKTIENNEISYNYFFPKNKNLCGNGICESNEDCSSCPNDCCAYKSEPYCGNGICEKNEIGVCYEDCEWCGNGYCEKSESCSSCSKDCGFCSSEAYCGDGICNSGECKTCSKDCKISQCIDGFCNSELGENCRTSPTDCPCFRGQFCDLNGKCLGYCGNGICESNEDCSCPDCTCESLKKCVNKICRTYCGNGVCENNENKSSCLLDCGEESFKGEDVDPNTNFPIIFVHGHSALNDYVSIYSLNAFKEFQSELEKESLYKDMGTILPNSDESAFLKGEWGRYGKPVSVRTTYYIGILDTSGNFIKTDENQRAINEYSDRLKKVVNIVLHHTGKNKVIIIAHSMGGLVARAYIKNYNATDKVDKLIMIGTPNHGIYGWLGYFCRYSYTGQECEDMQYNSNFITSLNKANENYSKYFTIAGNCSYDSDGFEDDEVVRVESVRLNKSTNVAVKCQPISGLDAAHSYLISPSRELEAYNYVKKFLKF